ncbi:hypothetical protein BCR34DRAFT_163836 [Clohesyomyces aquaticus]|uniref:Mitochondrial distribution and morphology protein 12 n=1 Tax=Clohesyomyces aquaticus TaxID=1231657 RepID=A0A1Y2A000_9PLEO|nr:hypothetical protein BCR34DRAFT_163836 [Clohesyomyces aquaticus]
MSIDISWDTLTGGADGIARAETIRAFIHDKFQQVTLPRFIRSVKVHSFDFGSISPEIEIKDICDPLPDFYEEDEDDPDEHEGDGDGPYNQRNTSDTATPIAKDRRPKEAEREASRQGIHPSAASRGTPFISTNAPSFRATLTPAEQLGSPLLPRTSTPGIPGGTSNINYFHLPLGAGLSGATTPLAAVAGAQFQGWSEYPPGRPRTPTDNRLRNAASFSSLTLTPQSHPDPASRPSSRHQHDGADSTTSSPHEQFADTPSLSPQPHMVEKSAEDIQVVAHVQYSGDIKMSLTAEILLDYPMPSFVGIPLKLNITGLTFDGVAILAYIKKKAHFCFLAPEDADALVGGETSLGSIRSDSQALEQQNARRPRIGGLLEHIKVESEIGDGKQVLKNVGKVESFVLEQVRRIFEDDDH